MESEARGRGGGGGWITFPFVIATMAGLSLSSGWIINFITFLQNEFNIQDTDAAKIYNYVNGSVTLFPIIALFLNRAAMKSLEDSRPDGSIISPWKLCTVQQVEDLKSLIKMLPIWLSGLILSIPIAVQLSFIVIHGKTMDSHLKSHFNIPAATMQVFTLISTCITISLLDRLVFPLWENLAPRPPTPLQRVGIGHVFTLLSMVVSAVVESKRLQVVKSHSLQDQMDAIAPISILWLAPQLAIVGVAEAFHFAGQVAFYYQEFHGSFKNTSTAVVAMSIGGAFYSSNLVIDLVRKATGWLPNNINQGRLDNVYWLCCIMGALNLVFYLVCASLYKYQKS